MTKLEDHIASYPNFPKKGILFRDISPLLGNPDAFRSAIDTLAKKLDNIDAIAGIDSRGFIFGSALAYAINKPFVMIRKKGKLPGDVHEVSYGLEYGSDTLQLQPLKNNKTNRVALIDDLLATGGTANAAIKLLSSAGYDPVQFLCIIELSGLNGREKLSVPTTSLVTYDDD